MAEISRRAGVGMATLYRNFPGRRELLEALYTDEVDAVCEAAGTGARRPARCSWPGCTGSSPSSPASTPWARAARGLDSNSHVIGQSRPRVMAAGRPLLLAAQRAHEVRDDLTLEQVLDMVIAIGTIHGGPGYLEPILQAALDGLRPPAAVGPA